MTSYTPNTSPPPPNPPPEDNGKRAAWGLAGAGGCLLVVALLLIIPAALAAGTVGGGFLILRGAFDTVFAGEPPRSSVVTSQTIVTQIRPLGQLVSTSAGFAKADIAVGIQQGRFAACNHSANHVASATINAGIDLFEISEDAVTYDEGTDTYTIVAPRPVLTSCSVDFIDQYERNLAIPTCRVDWDDARQIAQYEAMIDLRRDAVDGGLLETAERQTQLALTSFVRALTGSNVVVEFADTELTDEQVFANCQPTPPRDWVYVEADRQWVRTQ